MKATIAGITYEGTPEEISAMVLIQQVQNRNKPFKQPDEYTNDWLIPKGATTGTKVADVAITTSVIGGFALTEERLGIK